MYAPTSTVAPQSSALKRFLYRRRNATWMRARIAFNIFRVFIGVVILASMPWAGPLALLGIVPLAWAAVSSAWIYHVLHNAQSRPAEFTAR